MKDLFAQLWKIALITLIGVAGSFTVGLMMHGINVFVPSGADFAYLAFGAAAPWLITWHAQLPVWICILPGLVVFWTPFRYAGRNST